MSIEKMHCNKMAILRIGLPFQKCYSSCHEMIENFFCPFRNSANDARNPFKSAISHIAKEMAVLVCFYYRQDSRQATSRKLNRLVRQGVKSMNQVGIVGRLTKDPSMRVLGEGRVHTTFVVAISRNFRNQRGEIESDYVLCSTWGRTAQNVAKYCMKGSQVAITGRIQSRHYDKEDGSRVYVTEVIGDQVRFLDKRKPTDDLIPKRTEADSNAEFDFQPPETEQVNS